MPKQLLNEEIRSYLSIVETQSVDKATIEKIRNFRSEGLKSFEIADELGLDDLTVEKILDQYSDEEVDWDETEIDESIPKWVGRGALAAGIAAGGYALSRGDIDKAIDAVADGASAQQMVKAMSNAGKGDAKASSQHVLNAMLIQVLATAAEERSRRKKLERQGSDPDRH